MSIRVTCTGCHTRFDVSEKFAGKEGPCPKCKAKIQIPATNEQVVVHAPEHSGPKDSQGQSVLKPIARQETHLSAVQLTLIIASILGFLAAALVLRFMIEDKTNFPALYLGLGATMIAIPIAYVAYAFLRNQDCEPFRGQHLWARLGICGGVYVALWLLMPLLAYAFPNNNMGAIIGLIGMIAAGGATAMLGLELDYLFGILHYGMYLGICLGGRLLIGLSFLPGFEKVESGPSTVISLLQHVCELC